MSSSTRAHSTDDGRDVLEVAQLRQLAGMTAEARSGRLGRSTIVVSREGSRVGVGQAVGSAVES
jgi:hypothetical protein